MNIAAKVSHLLQPNNLELLPDPPFGFTHVRIKEINLSGTSYLSVDGFIALIIVTVSSEYDTSTPLEVFDSSGASIGFLTFTKSISAFDIAQLPSMQLAAYLTEIDLNLAILGDDYRFSYNYLVLEENKLSNYINNYFATAPLWGRFCHPPVTTPHYKNSNPKIIASQLNFSKSTFAESTIIQAINPPSPPERFLKLYHVLESDFDYIIAKKLQNITLSNSSNLLGELINSFGNSEYDRLSFMLEESIIDIPALVASINTVLLHQTKAETIFYTFNKPTNPLKELAHFKLLCSKGGFDQANFSGLTSALNAIPGNSNIYRIFIIKLTAYWIYRVRCCIAHKKIGEYMIQVSDEDLLVEFAEPLMREVLRQYLS